MAGLHLRLLAGEYAICRLAPDEPVPSWSGSAVFSAVTRTCAELSILCPVTQVPVATRHEAGWCVFELAGPFPFTATGVLASALTPLAAAQISILAQSTFETDYVLVKADQLSVARAALTAAGHTVG